MENAINAINANNTAYSAIVSNADKVLYIANRIRASQNVFNNNPRIAGQYFGGYLDLNHSENKLRVCTLTACFINDYKETDPETIITDEEQIDDNINWAVENLADAEDSFFPEDLFVMMGWDDFMIDTILESYNPSTDKPERVMDTLSNIIAVLNDGREWSYLKIADWLEDLAKNHPEHILNVV